MDPYKILGLPADASIGDIKKAFRQLARECHPDRTQGDPELADRFKQVRQAYELLIDPEKRDALDRGRARQRAQRNASADAFYRHTGKRPPDSGAPRAAPPPRAGSPGSVPPPVRPTTGSDVHTRCVIDPGVASAGGMVDATYHRLEHVAGWRPGMRTRSTERVEHTARFSVPAGTENGATVCVPGQGNAGQNGGDYGDLVVTVRLAGKAPAVPREARTTPSKETLPLTISVFLAILGGEAEVALPNGKAVVSIPAGTSSGEVLPSKLGGEPGPKFSIQIAVPKGLDLRSRELVQEVAQRVAESR